VTPNTLTALFEVYERHATRLGLRMEIYHSSIIDWRVTIEKRRTLTEGDLIVDVQHCDYGYVLTKAEIDLKKWLSEYINGY